MMDVDGDGIIDVVDANPNGTWKVYYGTGDTGQPGHPFFGLATNEASPINYTTVTVAPWAATTTGCKDCDVAAMPLDFDGDGWMDICSAYANICYRKIPGRGNGWSQTSAPITVGGLGSTFFRYVKRDREIDPLFLRQYPGASPFYCFQGITPYVYTRSKTTQDTIDINGDGLPDIVLADAIPWKVWFGKSPGH